MRNNANELLKIGSTGYRMIVRTYGAATETPSVVVDITDPSGTIIDRAVINSPVVTGQAPQLNIVRTSGAADTL